MASSSLAGSSKEERRQYFLRVRQERERVKAEYPVLYQSVLKILYLHNPTRVVPEFDGNYEDEYKEETGTIIPRLNNATSIGDVHTIVYEEFLFWYDKSAGSKEKYRVIAQEVWQALQQAGMK
jgi:hypothetical protein